MFIQSIIGIVHPCITCNHCCVQTIAIFMKKSLVYDSSSEETVSGMIIQDSCCAGIALFPTCMCAVFTVRLRALMFCKNLFWNTLLQTMEKITDIGQVLRAQVHHCQEENHDLPKQPLNTVWLHRHLLSSLTSCEDVRVCSEMAEVQIHVPFCWLL